MLKIWPMACSVMIRWLRVDYILSEMLVSPDVSVRNVDVDIISSRIYKPVLINDVLQYVALKIKM